jgi:hypothetical protein
MGGAEVTQAQLRSVLAFLGKIPVTILDALPTAIRDIDDHPDRYMALFMTKPRELLKSEFNINLPEEQYQIIAFDLSQEETPWAKVFADPLYPYKEGVKIGSVAIGFAEGRVGLVLRERLLE